MRFIKRLLRKKWVLLLLILVGVALGYKKVPQINEFVWKNMPWLAGFLDQCGFAYKVKIDAPPAPDNAAHGAPNTSDMA